MLIEREFIRLSESTVKVGRTAVSTEKRFAQYPKGSKLIASAEVRDSVTAERKLIALFNDLYERKSYGNEYFNGDLLDMQISFHSLANEVLRKERNDIEAASNQTVEDNDNIEVDIEIELSDDEYVSDDESSEDIEIDDEIDEKELIEITTTIKMGHKCGRVFKEKRCYDQHLKRKIPCDTKPVCYKCSKVFLHKLDLERHLARKTPCDITKLETINVSCINCSKTFSTTSNLNRHTKSCKQEANMQTLLDTMKQNHAEMAAMTKQLAEIKSR